MVSWARTCRVNLEYLCPMRRGLAPIVRLARQWLRRAIVVLSLRRPDRLRMSWMIDDLRCRDGGGGLAGFQKLLGGGIRWGRSSLGLSGHIAAAVRVCHAGSGPREADTGLRPFRSSTPMISKVCMSRYPRPGARI